MTACSNLKNEFDCWSNLNYTLSTFEFRNTSALLTDGMVKYQSKKKGISHHLPKHLLITGQSDLPVLLLSSKLQIQPILVVLCFMCWPILVALCFMSYPILVVPCFMCC